MIYKNGVYHVKSRGRGICLARLTKKQAQVIAELIDAGLLELEKIEFKHN